MKTKKKLSYQERVIRGRDKTVSLLRKTQRRAKRRNQNRIAGGFA